MAFQTLQRRTFTKLGFIDDALSVNASKEVDAQISDQTTEVINLKVTRFIQSIDLVAPASKDDLTITISSGVQPSLGNVLCLKENTSFYQGEILAVVANGINWDVTLDTPLDAPFSTLGGCSERSSNLAVDGSVTPVEFSVSPVNLSDGVEWDITRIIGTIISATSMDDGRFGGIAGGLPNGLVVRYTDGVTKNIFTVKTNGDLATQMYDVAYSDKAPAGEYGLRFRRTFAGQSKSGVAIRLKASLGDALTIIVQDDLSSLVDFSVVVHGHRTDTPVIT